MTDQKTKKAPRFLMTVSERWEIQRSFFERGIIPALYDALVLARVIGIEMPGWVIDGAIMVVGDRLKFGFTTGKGATGNELAKYQTAMKHYRRWQVVKQLHENGIVWTQVYFETEKLLIGTFAEAKHGTIKKSYLRVNKDLEDPEKYFLYYHAYHEVAELTGTPGIDMG